MNDIPKMPEGYYSLSASEGLYVLMNAGPVAMKRLKNRHGDDKRFDSLREATEYAHKHKATGLNFDREVVEA